MASPDFLKKLALWLPVLNIVCTLMIAVGGYVLVSRFSANESEANTRLAEIEISLKQIEAKMLKLKQGVEVSAELMRIIRDIQPYCDFKCKQKELKGKEYRLNYEITNLGQFAVQISKPELRLLSEEVQDYNDYSKDFVCGSDYTLDPFATQYCQPGDTIRVSVTFQVNPQTKKELKYIWINFRTETDKVVCGAAKAILGDAVPKNLVDVVSVGSYRGGFRLSRKKGLFEFLPLKNNPE